MALFVTDARGDHVLAESSLDQLPRMGVSRRAPGAHSSSWEDRPISLPSDGIDLFVFEAAAVLYYACGEGYCSYQISD